MRAATTRPNSSPAYRTFGSALAMSRIAASISSALRAPFQGGATRKPPSSWDEGSFSSAIHGRNCD